MEWHHHTKRIVGFLISGSSNVLNVGRILSPRLAGGLVVGGVGAGLVVVGGVGAGLVVVVVGCGLTVADCLACWKSRCLSVIMSYNVMPVPYGALGT